MGPWPITWPIDTVRWSCAGDVQSLGRRHHAAMNWKASLAAIVTALMSAGLLARSELRADAIPALPQHLSETGLFVHGSTTKVRGGVLPFSPQYPLWSDGASKRRWIHLPPGTFIDASRPGAWEFPVGTKLWKEFQLGRRIETRFIERLRDGSWSYATYVWNDEGSDAALAPPEGIAAAASTGSSTYAIPSESDCRACHEGAPVPVLGFSALQLSPDRDPLAAHGRPPNPDEIDLSELVNRGWVRNLPQTLIENPPRIRAASPAERAALGYLHGNCGHCHTNPNDSDASVPVDIRLATDISDPASTDKILQSLMTSSTRFRLPESDAALPPIAPGSARESALAVRMSSRNAYVRMPPLGTALPDSEGLALIARWIDHHIKKPKE